MKLLLLSLALTTGCIGAAEIGDGSPVAFSPDFKTECAEANAIKVIVTSTNGERIPGALVYPFPIALQKHLTDDNFPATNGLGQSIAYDAITTSTVGTTSTTVGGGEAYLCGFSPNRPVIDVPQVRVVKPGYELGIAGPIRLRQTTTATTVTTIVALRRNEQVKEPGILLMSCEAQHREASLLTRAGLSFRMAKLGGIIQAIDDYDPKILFVGFTCNKWEMFNELLQEDNNARLLKWVAQGHLLFLAQQNDSRWSRKTGCSPQALACPNEIFPEHLRYEILSENSKCNDYDALRIASSDATSDALTSGVCDWAGWNYTEQIADSQNRGFVCLDCIDADTVTDAWTKILTTTAELFPSTKTSTEAPPELEDRSRCPTEYNAPNEHVAAMYTKHGCGMIVVAHHAWEQGSEGESIGDEEDSDPNGKQARDAVIRFLTDWRASQDDCD